VARDGAEPVVPGVWQLVKLGGVPCGVVVCATAEPPASISATVTGKMNGRAIVMVSFA
jgi:hypothetical protein